MNAANSARISRRRFAGGMAAILGTLTLRSNGALAQGVGPAAIKAAGRVPVSQYDKLVKICYNENSYGPTKKVLDAMTMAFKFSNRYKTPDGAILDAIASLHGVSTEHILLGAGSSEILDVVGTAYLAGGKKVASFEPTFGAVYEHATGLNAGAIRLPLTANFRQNIPALIKAVHENQTEVGFVYLCNPNNPTGMIVNRKDVKQLVDELPPGMPILIDEAYHHFVEDPAYATSIVHVLEGRPVIVARTFSKIAAMAGMRLGYAVAPPEIIERLAVYANPMNVNVLAKWGGAAALADQAGLNEVRGKILGTRKRVTQTLSAMGYQVLPSEANFFMVNLRRDVRPVIEAFHQQGILVGRPFPPMLEYLRVSVGTDGEMDQFLHGFKTIMQA